MSGGISDALNIKCLFGVSTGPG